MDAARERKLFLLLLFIVWLVSSLVPLTDLLEITRTSMKIKKSTILPAFSSKLLSLLLKILNQFEDMFLNLDCLSHTFLLKHNRYWIAKRKKKPKKPVPNPEFIHKVSDQPWILIPHIFYTIFYETKSC